MPRGPYPRRASNRVNSVLTNNIEMRLLILACCAVAACTAAPQQTKYTDKYDNINLDEILSNNRLLIPYLECVLERGRCNAEGKELKEHLKDALETGCSKCTEKQEQGAYKVIEHLIKNELVLWRELVAKYDPDSKYRKEYEDRARAKGIVIPDI